MKKMFGKKLAFLLAAAVLAAGAFTSCEIDLGGDDGGSSSGSKLPNGTVTAVYDKLNFHGGTHLVVFYDDKTFVQAYTEDEYSYSITDAIFEITNEGTYKGDPTKDTGDNNKVLLTYTKLSNGGLYHVSVEEYVKEFPEWSLEDFKNREARITDGGKYFDCGGDAFAISDYSRNEDY